MWGAHFLLQQPQTGIFKGAFVVKLKGSGIFSTYSDEKMNVSDSDNLSGCKIPTGVFSFGPLRPPLGCEPAEGSQRGWGGGSWGSLLTHYVHLQSGVTDNNQQTSWRPQPQGATAAQSDPPVARGADGERWGDEVKSEIWPRRVTRHFALKGSGIAQGQRVCWHFYCLNIVHLCRSKKKVP